MTLAIYIFSYNRGAFLENALASVRHCAPDCDYFVVDDHSDEADTQALLQSLPAAQVLKPPSADKSRHGGLYRNMQLALEHCRADYCLFLQDDMQLVRPLDGDDLAYIEHFFKAQPQAAFLNPVFLKGQRHKRDARITKTYAQLPAYYRDYPGKGNQRGISYADVVIAHKARLQAVDWHFQQGEISNAAQAAEHFGKMGFMRDPFVMFLPQVPVFRGKQKTLPVRLAERWAGNEPKRFTYMSAQAVTDLRARPLQTLPVAEQFLHTQDEQIKKPYQYSVVNVYPWLRVWHKLILQLKK